jgi:hypothetical protein
VILTANLDESGTHGDSPVTVMGGMLANARQLEAFEKKFRQAKKDHGFNIFHTKKFKKRDGDFRGWDDGRMFGLMNDLAVITSSGFTEGVTFLLDNAAYDAEYKAGDGPRKLRLDSKYGLCFRNCLLFLSLKALKRMHRGRYPTLHFVLESGHKNAGDALRIFNEYKALLKVNDCDMLGDLLFADKNPAGGSPSSHRVPDLAAITFSARCRFAASHVAPCDLSCDLYAAARVVSRRVCAEPCRSADQPLGRPPVGRAAGRPAGPQHLTSPTPRAARAALRGSTLPVPEGKALFDATSLRM